MNHIYRTIYNRALGAWVAVAETAKSHSKTASSRQSGLTFNFSLKAITLAALMSLSAIGNQAMAGDVCITNNTSDSTLGATATGTNALACGKNATATSTNTVAIGVNATAVGNHSVAVGRLSETAGNNAVAVGHKAKALAAATVAIGIKAQAKSQWTVAIGQDAGAIGQKSIAIGGQSKAGQAVAPGDDPISGSTALGNKAWATGDQSLALGADTRALGDSSIAIGGDDLDNVVGTQAATDYNTLTGDSFTVPTSPAGYIKTEAGLAAIAVGVQTQATGGLSTAFGTRSKATASASVALGVGAVSDKKSAVALGAGSATDTAAANVIGTGTTIGSATYDLTFAGSDPANTSSNTSYVEQGDQVSVGKVGYERQIKHVAPGEISDTSTDAINGSQLYAVAKELDRENYFHVNSTGSAITWTSLTADQQKNLDDVDGTGAALGTDALAAGVNAKAYSNNSTAIGNAAQAGGNETDPLIGQRATAIGTSATATGSDSVALSYNANASGTNSVAIGNAAQSAGTDGVTGAELAGYSTAVGGVSSAEGQYATAIGYSADATKEYATALGNNAQATGVNSIAIGGSTTAEAATASGEGSISIGRFSDATAEHATAVGLGSQSTGKWSSAYGRNSKASGENATAVGNVAKALAKNASAFGSTATANTEESVALGFNSATGGSSGKSVAIGSGSRALADGSIALGSSSTANRAALTVADATAVVAAPTGNKVYAIGSANATDKTAIANTVAGSLGAVSVGQSGQTRQITNVAAGRDDSDAVNVAQLKSVATAANRENYFHVNDGTATQVAGNATTNKGTVDAKGGATGTFHSLAAGVEAKATGQSNIAIGYQAEATGDAYAVAIGREAEATASVATAIGWKAKATGNHDTAVGSQATASGGESTAIGRLATSSGSRAIAAGTGAQATATGASAFGNGADALNAEATALGHSTTASGLYSTAVGGIATASVEGATSIGYETNALAVNSSALGRGARVVAAGVGGVALGYQSQAKRAVTTAGAATSATPTAGTTVYALGSATTADKTAISNTVIGSNGAVSVGNEQYTYYDGGGNPVTVEANTRQITNLAAGAADTDAVNVAQLKAVANTTTAPLTVAGNINADTDAETLAGVTYKAGDGTQQQLGETLNIIGASAPVAGLTRNTDTAVAGTYSAKNVQTVISNGEVQIQLADNPEFKSIKAGDDIANNPITIGTNSTTNKNEITGLDGSLPDTYNTTTGGNTMTTAQVAPTLTDAQKSNAATVNDVLNSGWNLQAKGKAVDFVKPYDTVNFASSDGSVTITPETDGTTSKIDLKVDVQDTVEGAQLPVVYTNAAGDKVYKQVDNLGNVTFTTNPDGTGTTVPNGDVIASMQNADGSTTAPTTLSNVASTLPNTYNTATGGNTITTAQAAPTLTDAQKSNAATVGDVLNAGFNLKTTDKGDLDFVKAYDTIEFTDGTGTKVVSETDGTASKIKFNVNTDGTTTKTAPIDPTDPSKGTQIVVATGGITTNANGTVAGNTTNGTIATVGDVATAINNAGWNVQGNGNQVDLVTAGNTVNFADGAGTKANVVHSNGTTTVKYDANVDNTTITVNNAGQLTASGTGIANATNLNYSANGGTDQQVTLAKGLDFVNGANGNITASVGADGKVQHTLNKDIQVDNITVNKGVTVANGANVDMGNNVVSKVSSGLVDANGAPVTIANASGDTLTNAANIGDLQKVQTGLGNTYQVIGGQNTSGKAVDGSGAELTDSKGNPVTAQVALKTYAPESQGEKINNTVISAIKHMNEGGIKYFHTNDTDNQYATSETNTEDSQAGGSYSTAVGYKAKTEGAKSVALGNETVAQGTSSVAIGDGSKATGSQSIAIGTGNVVEASNSGAFGDPTTISGKTISGTGAVTGSYSIGNDNIINTSNTFVLGNNVNNDGTGNAQGSTVENSVYLGNKTAVTAGNAVGTANLTSDGKAGTTTTAGDKGTVTSATVNGVTYGGFAGAKADGAVSVGASGSERRVQNVAAGEISPTSTDAINGSQLYHVARQVGGVQRDIANVRADANAGTASAIAIASIGQAHKPGGKTVGMGVGTYRGESAISIGGSVISDNGKWILKGAINSNTRGHVGAGASVNYQW